MKPTQTTEDAAPAPAALSSPLPSPPTSPESTTAPKPGTRASPADLAAVLGESAGRSWWQRPRLWLGLGALLLLAAGGLWWQTHQAASAAPVYATQAVERGDITLTVTANGTVQPTRTFNIGSELSGTVRQVHVDVNDRIRKGQVLVALDTAKLQDQILRSQAALAAARARVTQAGATTHEARASLGRLEEVARLSGGKVPSQAELDAGRAALERALAEEASARAGVDEAQATLSTDRINLSKASITAPAEGVVLTRSVDPGNAVAASLQAVTLFTVAEDLRQLRLWVYVDEADVGLVQVGQDASFTVSAYPGRRFPARITRVGFGSTITDNVVTYLCHLDVDNPDLSLRPGMTATATITAARRTGALLVPNTALRFTPGAAPAGGNAASGQGLASRLVPRMPGTARRPASAAMHGASARRVWVLREGQAVPVVVVPGISDGRMTEIVGGELQPGMRVITDQKSAPAR